MTEIQIHQDVAKLLKPLKSKNPTGEDISKSEDPVANAAFTDLEMEISKLGEINYQKTGYKTDGLLDIHYITDKDIEKKDSYALKISAVADGATRLELAEEIK